MKKFISVLLVAVMMFSFTVTGFAARESVELGKTYTVTVKNDEVVYSFFAPESGIYSIEFELLSKVDGTYVDVLLESFDNYLGGSFLYFIEDDAFLADGTHFIVDKNQEIRISISNEYADFVDDFGVFTEATVSFVVKKANDLTELKMGESYTFSEESKYYVLYPTSDGIYNIWSHGSGSVWVETVDGYVEGGSFWSDEGIDLSFMVTAGETYLIEIANDIDETESLTFSVADGSKISPEVIEIEEITIVKDNYGFYGVYVLPNGAFYNYDELVFELENDKIADIEYDKEYQMISVWGNKIGKTTLKITEPISGITAETTIRVVSPLRMFFIELFEYIADIFTLIFAR